MGTGTILRFAGASECLVVNYTFLDNWGWIVAPIALCRSTLHSRRCCSLHDWNGLEASKIVKSGPHFPHIAFIHFSLGVDGRLVIHTNLLKYSLALIGNVALIGICVVLPFTRLAVVIYILLLKAVFLQSGILLKHFRWISDVLNDCFDRLMVGCCSACSIVNDLIAARIEMGCVGGGSLSMEWSWIFYVILLLRSISISFTAVLITILIALVLWRLVVLAVTIMLTVNFLCMAWIDAFTGGMLLLTKGETIVIHVALS